MMKFIAVVGVLGLIIANTMWGGYVFTVLWAWFVVPTFKLQALTLAPAIGLSLMVRFVVYKHRDEAKPPEAVTFNSVTQNIAKSAVVSTVVLCIGAVVQQFM